MAPLGSATPPAVSSARARVAEKVGGIAAKLAGAGVVAGAGTHAGFGIRPGDILKRENFENAVTYV